MKLAVSKETLELLLNKGRQNFEETGMTPCLAGKFEEGVLTIERVRIPTSESNSRIFLMHIGEVIKGAANGYVKEYKKEGAMVSISLNDGTGRSYEGVISYTTLE